MDWMICLAPRFRVYRHAPCHRVITFEWLPRQRFQVILNVTVSASAPFERMLVRNDHFSSESEKPGIELVHEQLSTQFRYKTGRTSPPLFTVLHTRHEQPAVPPVFTFFPIRYLELTIANLHRRHGVAKSAGSFDLY
jgi:hypothetical protein